MEKVKLTREQAAAVEIRRNMDMFEESIKCHIKGQFQGDENKALAELSLDEFIRALYIGYEVEETFEVGDWVFDRDSIYKIISKHHADDLNKGMYSKARHATTEEIAEEKQRRWWAKHGREVWELREGDLLERLNDMKIIEFLGFDQGALEYRIRSSYYREYREDILGYEKRYRVVCFAEDRKDVK